MGIQLTGGIPTMQLNGKPWFGFSANRPYLGDHLEIFQTLSQVGLKHFQFDTTCTEDLYHPELRFWKSRDTFDPSAQEAYFKKLVAICPDALFTLRLGVYAPDWWIDENPSECQLYADGSDRRELQRAGVRRLPSLASEKWQADANLALVRYVEWLISSGWSRHVCSIFLTSGITWEWALLGTDGLLDYSPHGLAYFRNYLREKYSTDEGLTTAWGRNVTLATAEIPAASHRMKNYGSSGLRPIPEEQNVVDHQQSLSAMNVDFLLSLAATLKQATENQIPVGTFYGYTLTAREQTEFTGQFGAGGFFGGHHEFGRVLRSPDIDFFASPFNYANRALGTGLLYEHVALASIHKNGKAFWDENDMWTFTNPPTPGALPPVMSIGYTPTREETILTYRRAWASAIVRGKHQWLTELTGWIGEFRENFTDPELIQEIKRWNDASANLLKRDRSPNSQVAFVLDETSIAYLSADHKDFLHQVYHGTVRWALLGVPFDLILLEDLLEHPNDYRLVIPACIKNPTSIAQFKIWQQQTGCAVHWDETKSWYPSEDKRELLAAYESAGIHRYVNEGTVWANATMLMVHVNKAGEQTVDFGRPLDGTEFFTDRSFSTPTGSLRWNFSKKGVALFLLEQ